MLRPAGLAAFLAGLAFLSACSKVHDPTEILPQAPTETPVPAAPLPTPTPLPSGVQFNVSRLADPSLGAGPAVQHVWVESGGINILTLWTTSGGSSYDCSSIDFCPCENPNWPSYCAANTADLTDANTHPTVYYPVATNLAYNWDWRDRGGSLVPNGTYILRAEVSRNINTGYTGTSLASVTVIKNGLTGSASGTFSGRFSAASATWNP